MFCSRVSFTHCRMSDIVQWPGQSLKAARMAASMAPPGLYDIRTCVFVRFYTDEMMELMAKLAGLGDWVAMLILANEDVINPEVLPQPFTDVTGALVMPMATYAWRRNKREVALQIFRNNPGNMAACVELAVAEHLNDDDYDALIATLRTLPQDHPAVAAELAYVLDDGEKLEQLGELARAGQAYLRQRQQGRAIDVLFRAVETTLDESACRSLCCINFCNACDEVLLRRVANLCTYGKVALGLYFTLKVDRRGEGAAAFIEAGVLAGGPKMVAYGMRSKIEQDQLHRNFLQHLYEVFMNAKASASCD